MKPVIGITADIEAVNDPIRGEYKYVLLSTYVQAVEEAGGLPLILPSVEDATQIASLIDGWLIPGGNDIDARHFGEENHPAVKLELPERFAGEEAMYKAISPDLPILGICYGCQFLNVIEGGTLIQHVPDVVGHVGHEGGTLQNYTVTSGTKLAEALGEIQAEGRSYHHQAIKAHAPSAVVTAHAEDGTIEAIEFPSRTWVVGVQWHPERTLQDPQMQRLVATFVNEAATYRAKHRRS